MSQGKQLNLELIPTDLIMEIFSRLPIKSIGRLRSVSKLWGSMLGSPELTALFMTMSSARPHLLFAVQGDGDEWLFYSAPQPEKSSLVIAADFHTKFGGSMCKYVSGLIYYPGQGMICNPITGHYVTLPKLDCYRRSTGFVGFDPIEKQLIKVLAETYQKDHHEILTLGTRKLRWRKTFHCPRYNYSFYRGKCIDGVLYYLADNGPDPGYRIICFDVRSEKFNFIDGDCIRLFENLINYKGKLCGIRLETHELSVWILEDVEKHEWFKYVYTLPENEQVVDYDNLYVVGVTSTGEIVLALYNAFCLYYFNSERNIFQRIEIQGIGAELKDPRVVYTFIDHIEDLRLIDAKQLKSSIYAPSVKNKDCSLNIIRARPKPQHREDGKLRDKKHRERRKERYTREDEDRKRKRIKKRRRD